jgi:hypothetical protein
MWQTLVCSTRRRRASYELNEHSSGNFTIVCNARDVVVRPGKVRPRSSCDEAGVTGPGSNETGLYLFAAPIVSHLQRKYKPQLEVEQP